MNTPPPLQWDLFCQVIDNYGDIGVCWRLASQLAARGQRVRLWVDDASALAWMAPEGCPGVELRDWNAPPPSALDAATDVLVEAFGCEIPPAFLAHCTATALRTGQRPVWINLEYLSAESYVERMHRLPSPLQQGPAAGWTRWFFYPGFTPRTGGLLRETDLHRRQQAFATHDRAAWRAAAAAGHGPGVAQARWISLFSYEPAALPALLDWAQQHPTHLLVTPGRSTQAVQALVPPPATSVKHEIGLKCLSDQRGQLCISYLNPCPQAPFDHLLWACDFNAVRGEDSLVRALWAGQALVWHIYPQHDQAHHDKLQAFLDWLDAPPTLRRFHAAWNQLDDTPLEMPAPTVLAEWTACVQAARARLLAQDDLVSQLLGFVMEKR
ncbi:MAG: elongation factor P maturation arginine rhamnosyltransferase EarP [Burkholderiaceae bacterium]|nr:elongation factor P maturation arginine rhamnosyltransferase EarP [Burkholderiaceae bacterium]